MNPNSNEKEIFERIRKNYGEKWKERNLRRKDILDCIRNGDSETLNRILDETKETINLNENNQSYDAFEFPQYNQEIVQSIFDEFYGRENHDLTLRVISDYKPFLFYIRVNRKKMENATMYPSNMNLIIENRENKAEVSQNKGGKAEIVKFKTKAMLGLDEDEDSLIKFTEPYCILTCKNN